MAIIKDIKISEDYITLGQFIKITNFISSGGQAKLFLLNNNVLVNNQKEERRGRKLYKNDLIQIDEKIYKIC